MLTQVLKDSYLFFRLNFKSICGIVLPVLLPQVVLAYLVEHHLSPEDGSQALNMILFGINILCYSTYTSALIYFFNDVLTGGFTSERDYIAKGLKAFPLVAFTVMATTSLTVAGLMLLVVPGIIVSVRLSLSNFHLLLSDESPMAAIRRSFRQTKGHTGTIFGALLIGGLPFMAVFALYASTAFNSWDFARLVYPVYDILMELASTLLLVILFRFFCLLNREPLPE